MRTPNRILLEVLKRKRVSKGELAEIVGVSKSTISYFVSKMARYGMIENRRVRIGRGRPRELVSISKNAWRVIGMKVGREEVIGVLFDSSFEPVRVERLPVKHDMRNPEGYETLMRGVFSRLDSDAIAVGVAISGVVDRGRVSSEILGLFDFDVSNVFAISKSVTVMNDVEALAVYENHFHGGGRFLVVNYGTGIGASFYDGRILKAGERTIFQIGHAVVDPEGEECYCGKRGCLETVASDYANLKRYTGTDFTIKEFVEYEWERFKDVLEEMRNNGSRGEIPWVYEESVEKLGLVLSNIVHILEPEKVVLYGEGVSDWFVEALKRRVEEILKRPVDFVCRSGEILAFEKGVAFSATESFIRSFKFS